MGINHLFYESSCYPPDVAGVVEHRDYIVFLKSNDEDSLTVCNSLLADQKMLNNIASMIDELSEK